MMPQITVFGLTLQSYGTVATIAALTGAAMVWYPFRKCGYSKKAIVWMLILMCIAFLVGARLWNVLANPESYGTYRHWYEPRLVGLSLYGGILGSFLVLLAATRICKISLLSSLDACVIPSGVAFCISRVGCFLNGCCKGIVSDVPWAMVFPSNLDGMQVLFITLESQSVHPTQLYELILALIGIPLCILLVKRRFPAEGSLFLSYGAWFSAIRLAVLPFRSLPYPDYIKYIVYPAIYLFLTLLGILLLMRVNHKREKGCDPLLSKPEK